MRTLPLILLLALATEAIACSCRSGALFNALPDTEALVHAKLTKAELTEVTDALMDGTPISGEATVLEVYWGHPPKTLAVRGFSRGDSCSTALIVGETYLLFIEDGEPVRITACSLSRQFHRYTPEEMKAITETRAERMRENAH